MTRRTRFGRRTCRTEWLALCCSLVVGGEGMALFAPMSADETGFGGVGGDAEHADESDCRWRDDDGKWVACDALLSSPDGYPTTEHPTGFHRVPDAPDRVSDGAPSGDGSKTSKPRSPFDVLSLGESAEAPPPPPLVRARQALTSLRDEGNRMRRGQATREELLSLRQALRMEELVVGHAEEIAFRRMQRCVAEHRLPPIERVQTHRMTPAGPIPLTPEELAATAPRVEPYPCERVRVVDEPLVAALRRFYEISRKLHEDDFGWHRRDERKVLVSERQELLRLLEQDDPLIRHRRPPDWRKLP